MHTADKAIVAITVAIIVLFLAFIVWGNDMGNAIEVGLLNG